MTNSDPALTLDSALDQQLTAYDYELPEAQIAQEPASPRDSARLFAVTSPTTHQHTTFRHLPEFLQPGDLLVLNNTRVIPARLYGHKSSGSPVEVLLVEEIERNRWLALVKPGKRLKPGARIEFEVSMPEVNGDRPSEVGQVPILVEATVEATDAATNGRILKFHLPDGDDLWSILPHLGQIPLPPYVTNTAIDSERYQTVYSEQLGAIAAPTAGLHFTPELLQHLQDMGIHQAFITLHVGVGTFRPVEVEDITTHAMHSEWIDVPASTVEQIRQTKEQGGRVIAVGTTVTRALEAAAHHATSDETLVPYRGKTDLFIYPGYSWQVVDGLITNFHLPKSSLLMLVSALIGRSRLLALYGEAIAHRYRFYSFGDAMLILPEAKI